MLVSLFELGLLCYISCSRNSLPQRGRQTLNSHCKRRRGSAHAPGLVRERPSRSITLTFSYPAPEAMAAWRTIPETLSGFRVEPRGAGAVAANPTAENGACNERPAIAWCQCSNGAGQLGIGRTVPQRHPARHGIGGHEAAKQTCQPPFGPVHD